MNFEIIPLQELDAAALAHLAALHSAVMPTLLADLGSSVVARYYEIAQKEASVVGLCLVADSGELLGWALGSPDPAALNAKLRQPLTWFAAQMLRLALTHPRVLFQLAQSVLSASNVNILQPGQLELTYIGVAGSAQGQGLGKSLLAAFLAAARAAGYQSVVLSVETDNPSALALYTRLGFSIAKTFREGQYHRHRMEFSLSQAKI